VYPIVRSRAHCRTAGTIVTAVALIALAPMALSGCGSSIEPADSASAGADAPAAQLDKRIAAQLPPDVRRRGTLVAGTDATYAPNEFIGEDGETIVGMSPELAEALSGVLGVKIEMRNATYDSILPGIATGRYDLVISSMTDTKERQQTVDFVDYFSAGTSFYTTVDGPAITSLADLCGHKVAAQKATTQQSDVQAQAGKCQKDGKPAATPVVFPDQNAVNLALSSGRADVAMADSPVASYQVRQSAGKFKLVGETYGTAPYGIGVKKGSELVKPLRAAVQKLIDSGTYAKILAKWGNAAGAVEHAEVNGGKG
jgi:polar amino acid transport system substrate-binding protein